MSPRSFVPPKVVLAFDWDLTLCPEGMRTRFLRHKGVDVDQLETDFKAMVHTPKSAPPPGLKRQLKLQYLLRRLENGSLPALPGRAPVTITIDDLAEFARDARKIPLYPGAWQTLKYMRLAVEQAGARPVVAVISNTWAPLIRHHPWTQGMVDEIHAQEFTTVRDASGRPVGLRCANAVSEATKPAALASVMRKHDVQGHGVLYVADGYSDEAVMRSLHNQGGRSICLLNDHIPHTANAHEFQKVQKRIQNDRRMHQRYQDEGIVDMVAPHRMLSEGSARNALVAVASMIAKREVAIAEHRLEAPPTHSDLGLTLDLPRPSAPVVLAGSAPKLSA